MILSLDTETYGAIVGPEQNHFHPIRSLIQDRIPLSDLVLCASITQVESPCSTNISATISSPSQVVSQVLRTPFKPSNSMVFAFDKDQEKHYLSRWLKKAHSLLLMNAQYDLLYLRTLPEFRNVLDGRHLVVDLAVLNYLECEVRPERSLKTVGPVLRTHIYERTAKDKFSSRDDPKLKVYNAEDTHNTVLAASEICSRVHDRTDTAKLSPFCLEFYSDTIWSCVRMSEAGIPMSLTKLRALEEETTAKCENAKKVAESFGLKLEGEGSHKSKAAFIEKVIEEIDAASGNKDSVRSHPLLVLTDTTKKISFSEENRKLLKAMLPPSSQLHAAMEAWGEHASSQKLISSYIYPLLHHKRNNPSKENAKVIPCSALTSLSYLGLLPEPSSANSSTPTSDKTTIPDEIGLAFPTWYVVPTQAKDTSDDSGGTLQGRITLKNPSGQTFPPPIQECIRSRYGQDGVILVMDLEQIELKVGALLSKDEGLVSEYLKPKPNLHSKRAIEIWGPDVVNSEGWYSGDKKVDKRQWGKTLNFADFFLASAHRMQATILELSGQLLPLSFFEEIEYSRWRQRPGLTAWQMGLALIAEEQGFIELPFTGQSRYFTGFVLDRKKWNDNHVLRGLKGTGKDLISEIVNFPVQTTAGNTMLRVQARLHKTLPHINYYDPPCRMFMNVYDALKFDCKKSFLPELKGLIEEAILYVRHKEYWSWIQEMQKVEVPLTYGLKEA